MTLVLRRWYRRGFLLARDKIHISISLYMLMAAISVLIWRHLCERDRAVLSRTVDKYSLLVTPAIFLAINVLMISNAVISK